jgi:hypothetical protein
MQTKQARDELMKNIREIRFFIKQSMTCVYVMFSKYMLMKIRINFPILRVGGIAFGGVLVFLVQQYVWTDAGKYKISNAAQYQLQETILSEYLHSYFSDIHRSDAYSKVSLKTGEKQINQAYLDSLIEYQYQLSQILRILNHYGSLVFIVMQDSTSLMETVLPEMSDDEKKQILHAYDEFSRLTKSFERRREKINGFQARLKAAFPDSYEGLSDEERVESKKKLILVLKDLYSDEELFLKHNSDPFKFVRDFGVSVSAVIQSYEQLIARYNDIVRTQDSYKSSLLTLILLLTAFFSFRKELDGLS